MLTKLSVAILLGFVLISVYGCTSKPNDEGIKQALIDKMKNLGFNEYYAVQNLKKTNGFEKDQNTYVAEVEFDLVEPDPPKSGRTPKLAAEAGNFFHSFLNIQAGMHFVQNITLIKTEKGWVFDKMELKSASNLSQKK